MNEQQQSIYLPNIIQTLGRYATKSCQTHLRNKISLSLTPKRRINTSARFANGKLCQQNLQTRFMKSFFFCPRFLVFSTHISLCMLETFQSLSSLAGIYHTNKITRKREIKNVGDLDLSFISFFSLASFSLAFEISTTCNAVSFPA